MSRRSDSEEDIVLSSFPLGISIWGFLVGSGVAVQTPPPPQTNTSFFIMQDGSRYLTQSGDKYLQNG